MAEKTILAGGCFWGVEELFRRLPGVLETRVGYTGGHTQFPKYEDVKTGSTGHAEAIEVVFESAEISFQEILRFFFKMHDPTTLNKQGNDIGSQYRSCIFYTNEAQKQDAEAIIKEIDKSGKWGKPVATTLEAFKDFYLAEEYHQDYLKKNPGGYTCHYIRN